MSQSAAATPLFPPTLLPPAASTSLAENYTIRPLLASDYHLGYLDVLRVLTTVGPVSESDFASRFDEMRSMGGYYLIVVTVKADEGRERIVGTGGVIVERKL